MAPSSCPAPDASVPVRHFTISWEVGEQTQEHTGVFAADDTAPCDPMAQLAIWLIAEDDRAEK